MKPIESLQAFYSRTMDGEMADFSYNNAGAGHFNVFPRVTCQRTSPYGRRDFYKVTLIIGTGVLTYSDKRVVLDKPALMFSNPIMPYSWQATSEEQGGYYCLFTEAFVNPDEKNILHDSPLFRTVAMPVFFVTQTQEKEIAEIFRTMIREMGSDYAHKFDLLRNYLHVIIHQAMKMQPAEQLDKNVNASSRLTHLFTELLERQFPIGPAEAALKLKTANQYAEVLSVHVNHLNRALKEVTGKTTTELISERIVKEATALLRHSDWNIAQIAYALGFEYPAYFNIFFKKQMGMTPKEARLAIV